MRYLTWPRFLACLPAALLILLGGCGGGGGSSETDSTPERPAAVEQTSLYGVAAAGAAVSGVVQLKDSSTNPVQLSTTTASDGSFAFNTTGLKPPFLLRTTTTMPVLYSLAESNGLANLTPLTTLALAAAAQGTDLATLYTQHTQADVTAAAARMGAAVASVQSLLTPLLNSYGVSGNLVTAAFSANHTGMDALLDAITVSFTNGSVTLRNKATQGLILSGPVASLSSASLIVASLPSPAASGGTATGTDLYTANCAGCHGAVGSTSLRGAATAAGIQAAISANRGGMGALSGLSAIELQRIADAVAPVATPPVPTPPATAADGAALYASQCSGCHGALASSSKLSLSVVRLQNAISGNVGGMGALATLSAADLQAIVAALNPASTTPTPTPAPPDGTSLYTANCASCHGALANSSKLGATLARLQNAITSNVGGMGALSGLSVTEVQAIVTALTPSTPTPTPAADGATLYGSYCSACHGSLTGSAKGGATAAAIQSAIAGNLGGMGALSTLNSAQLAAVATALAGITPAPATPAACGSCHAIPPATGRHAKHLRQNLSCGTCHGSGYSSTTVVAALHQNGVKNVATNIGWNSTSRSCSNSCHGKETW